jgi:16S rRNA (cytidine1402-2'-O)-methyltransferase
MSPTPGTLYVVATPIGNLEDLTFRALRTLREVDLIAAEDTRRTAKLLNHYEVRKPMVSLREHNEAREAERLVAKLLDGQNIAVVSDAGTPGIADPGARLVRISRERGVRVVPIPGPNVIAAALSVSGLETDQFVFMGFPPSTGADRGRWFEQLALEERPAVFFEAPHRVARTLKDIQEQLVNRPIHIYRELTKIHETLVICHIDYESQQVPAKGEFTVVVEGRQAAPEKALDPKHAAYLFGRLTDLAEFSAQEAYQMIGSLCGVSERRVVKAVKKGRILVNRSN